MQMRKANREKGYSRVNLNPFFPRRRPWRRRRQCLSYFIFASGNIEGLVACELSHVAQAQAATPRDEKVPLYQKPFRRIALLFATHARASKVKLPTGQESRVNKTHCFHGASHQVLIGAI